ncbi:MAG TPA: hypothetical protein VF698_07235 [Thermoanaerobaculia bacterium]
MIFWIGAILFAVVGIALIASKVEVARLQSMVAGGTMLPGCVAAQGVLLLIAAAIVAGIALGFFRR